MAISESKLVQLCAQTATAAEAAVAWLEQNKEGVGSRSQTLRRDFRRRELRARRYENAAQRPLCIGVFGPSQVGKSYLVSALARKGADPLMVMLDKERDFLKDINPEAAQEATGLVTRFSINPTGAPASHPVAVRLLNQIDLVKILANTYYLDFNATKEKVPSPDDIEKAFDQVKGRVKDRQHGVLAEVDIDDLKSYFETQFANRQIRRILNDSNYWPRLEQLAPRLPIEDRVKLYALLWGELSEFSTVYTSLYRALEGLGFESDAYCPISALIPREQSIINVAALAGLSESGGDEVQVRGSSGRIHSIARSQLTAIVAELVVQIKEQPWDYFKHTDLLDFPGARTREMNEDAEAYVKKPGAIAGLFRRGKVAYLFDRYCNESELTSMLLCLQPGNQEVRTLPGMISDWVHSTHGPNPAERARQNTALFLVLTKFDRRFEISKGTESQSWAQRWTAAIQTSITEYFTGNDNWAQEWHPEKPFDNAFWLRNPNFLAEGLMQYDDNGRETGVASSKRIAQAKSEYLANDQIKRHFRDPEESWNAAFSLNDGGIKFLANSLAPVCKPELKRQQIEARVRALRNEMKSALAEFNVGDDLSAQKASRGADAAKAVVQLQDVVKSERFGNMLGEMQVSNDELQSVFRQMSLSGNLSDGVGADVSKLLEDIGLGAEGPPTEKPRDRYSDLANAALEHWYDRLNAFSHNARTLNFLRAKSEMIEIVVREIFAGSQRIKLGEQIAEQIRLVSPPLEHSTVSMLTPAMVSAEAINQYIWKLNQDQINPSSKARVRNGAEEVFRERDDVDTIDGLPDRGDRFFQPFIRDWFASLLYLVDKNSDSGNTLKFKLEESKKLSDIIAQIES